MQSDLQIDIENFNNFIMSISVTDEGTISRVCSFLLSKEKFRSECLVEFERKWLQWNNYLDTNMWDKHTHDVAYYIPSNIPEIIEDFENAISGKVIPEKFQRNEDNSERVWQMKVILIDTQKTINKFHSSSESEIIKTEKFQFDIMMCRTNAIRNSFTFKISDEIYKIRSDYNILVPTFSEIVKEDGSLMQYIEKMINIWENLYRCLEMLQTYNWDDTENIKDYYCKSQ